MEKILTGNHRLLRNLNRNVILNHIRIKVPTIGTQLKLVKNITPQQVQSISNNPKNAPFVIKDATGNFMISIQKQPLFEKYVRNNHLTTNILLHYHHFFKQYINMSSHIIA